MEQIILLDKEVFLYLNNLGNESWDQFWLAISYRFNWIPFYILLLYLVFKNFGWKQTLLILGLSVLMIVITDQMTNLIKHSVQRYRPCRNEAFIGMMRAVDCGGRFGFTSAHASNHFAIALFLGLIFRSKIKWLLPALLIWAAVISYSRIYLGVHYPLDIICGALFGLSLATLTYIIYQKINSKYNLSV